MFETVAPEITNRRSRKVFYETLPLSLGLHAVAIAAVMAGMLWKIDFPVQSPKLFQMYDLVEAPPPPPPPPPPPAVRRAVPVNVVIPPEMQNLAPTIIPDTVPDLNDTPPPAEAYEGTDGGIEGGVEGGVVGGVTGGVLTPAPPPPPPPPPAPQPEIVEIERDAPLPMPAVAQEYPAYPEFARTRGWEDSLVVRYIIDKQGRVREVTTLRPPAMKLFEEEAHKTIRHWRFQPYVVNGKVTEVIHELTVEFKIAKPSRGR
jgi:periplasmic protein TonB